MSQAGQTTPPDTTAFMHGPNPEWYLQTGEGANPMRTRAPYVTMQPEIPVKEPWAVSSVYIQNTKQSTAQPRNQVAPGSYIGNIKALAPPMTTQRDLLYDDADFHRLQRFYFTKTQSQRYFDQRTPLPEFSTPSQPAHAVIAGNNEYFPTETKRGWYQSFVPGSAGVSPRNANELEVGTSPPLLLSTPLNVKTITYSEYDHVRQPIKATAPKRKKNA